MWDLWVQLLPEQSTQITAVIQSKRRILKFYETNTFTDNGKQYFISEENFVFFARNYLAKHSISN